MSNYINVLRRLERERRAPDGTPAAPVHAPAIVPMEAAKPVPIAETRIAPVAKTITPEPAITQVAPIASAPAAERTIVSLPNAPSAPNPAPLEHPAVSTAAPVSVRPRVPSAEMRPAAPADTRRARAFATEAHAGIATLLDAIRLISNGRARRVVVFCGASNAEAVTTLAEDLVTHALHTGMHAHLASLVRTSTGTMIAPGHATVGSALAVDLDAGASVEALTAWADQIDPASDLVVITGPPLASSIDAALLACASDGLVIIAESEVTERAALQLAAERARIAGCKTLGVVMHGSKDRLPKWLRRLMGTGSESHVS